MRCPALALVALAAAGCFRAAPVPAPTPPDPVVVNVAAAPPGPVPFTEPWCRAVLTAGLVAELAGEPMPALVSAGLLPSSSRRAVQRPTTGQARGLVGVGLLGLGAADQPLLLVGRLGLSDSMYLHYIKPPILRRAHVQYLAPTRAQATNVSFWGRTSALPRPVAQRPAAPPKQPPAARPPAIRTRR